MGATIGAVLKKVAVAILTDEKTLKKVGMLDSWTRLVQCSSSGACNPQVVYAALCGSVSDRPLGWPK